MTQERSVVLKASLESDSTQTSGFGHEIAEGLSANDPPLGALHVDPLKVVLRSFSSIAEQNFEVGQEMASRARLSIEAGELQVEPLYRMARPFSSTAADLLG